MSKSIMLLGTSSGAGKSTVVTGICRILYQDGYKVAPFKAQNISDNVHILENGSLMARSQAIAAYACGLEPESDMNPILLKMLKGKTEVIIGGKSFGEMNRAEFEIIKKDIWSKVLNPYKRLSDKYEIIVLEGAGSPVEMNLKSSDFVNIATAQKTNSPVLLVADIDRGGAFASVYGTLMLLEENERSLIKGIVLNRLRGKKEQFEELKIHMEKITGIPVVGMIPYLDIKIEDEDNLTDANTGAKPRQSIKDMICEFDSLAKNMRENFDIPKLYSIIEKGVD